jgi:hypothetical protein
MVGDIETKRDQKRTRGKTKSGHRVQTSTPTRPEVLRWRETAQKVKAKADTKSKGNLEIQIACSGRLRTFLKIKIQIRPKALTTIFLEMGLLSSSEGPAEELTEQLIDACGYDDLPHRWMMTNHSYHSIQWLSVNDNDTREEVKKLVNDYYAQHISEPATIYKPAHVTGSDIFYIADRQGRALFLKLYRQRPADRELASLVSLQEEVADAAIFPAGEYLRPKMTSSDTKWVSNGRIGIAYQFLTRSDMTHFAGRYVREIASVGHSLGLLNAIISNRRRSPAVGFANGGFG